jgi:hypothetical protein
MRGLRSKLTFANVCSFLALVIALGTGGAYAANTVGSEDVIDNSLLTVDIKNNQIRGADVRDDTLAGGGLTAADLAPNSAGLAELDPAAFQADDISPTGLFNRYQIAIDAIQGNEVQDETLTGADVANGTLNDEDIGQASFVNFTGQIGTIQAHDCVYKRVEGLPVDNDDHLVLTPEVTTSKGELIYLPKWDASEGGNMFIQVCNLTNAAVNDGNTQFNLLEIDAQ